MLCLKSRRRFGPAGPWASADQAELRGLSQQLDPSGGASCPTADPQLCSFRQALRGEAEGGSSLVLTGPRSTHLGSLCSALLRWDQVSFVMSSHGARSLLGLLVAESCVLVQDV